MPVKNLYLERASYALSDSNPEVTWSTNLLAPETNQFDLSAASDPENFKGAWLKGRTNIYGPPPTIIEEHTNYTTPGSLISPMTHGPREFIIPVKFRTEDPDDITSAVSDLLTNLDPIANLKEYPLYLTYENQLSVSRTIEVVLISYELNMERHKDSRIAHATLILKAPYPYWQSKVRIYHDQFAAYPLPSSTNFWNAGNVSSYPQIWIYGPCSGAEITNQETGQTITLAHTIPSGKAAVIETEPGFQSAYLQDIPASIEEHVVNKSESIHFSVDHTSEFWSLAPGSNQITIDYTSPSHGVGQQGAVTYRYRYLDLDT